MNTKAEDNLTLIEFPELGIDLLVEIQSLPIRINLHKSKEQIGVVLVEAAGVGQATIKLLYVDSTFRNKFMKKITQALALMGLHFGFKEKLYQRRKPDGRFLTFFKKILRK
jgi:hypothetical protein